MNYIIVVVIIVAIAWLYFSKKEKFTISSYKCDSQLQMCIPTSNGEYSDYKKCTEACTPNPIAAPLWCDLKHVYNISESGNIGNPLIGWVRVTDVVLSTLLPNTTVFLYGGADSHANYFTVSSVDPRNDICGGEKASSVIKFKESLTFSPKKICLSGAFLQTTWSCKNGVCTQNLDMCGARSREDCAKKCGIPALSEFLINDLYSRAWHPYMPQQTSVPIITDYIGSLSWENKVIFKSALKLHYESLINKLSTDCAGCSTTTTCVCGVNLPSTQCGKCCCYGKLPQIKDAVLSAINNYYVN